MTRLPPMLKIGPNIWRMAIQAHTVSMFQGGKKLNHVLIMRVRTLHFVLPITQQTYLRWQKAGSLKRKIIMGDRTMIQWVQLLVTTQRWYGRAQQMLVAGSPIIIKRTFFPAAIYLLVISMGRCRIRRSSSLPSILFIQPLLPFQSTPLVSPW